MICRPLTDIICTMPYSCCMYEYNMHKKQLANEKVVPAAVKKQNALVLKRTAIEIEIDELDTELLIISVYYTFPILQLHQK